MKTPKVGRKVRVFTDSNFYQDYGHELTSTEGIIKFIHGNPKMDNTDFGIELPIVPSEDTPWWTKDIHWLWNHEFEVL